MRRQLYVVAAVCIGAAGIASISVPPARASLPAAVSSQTLGERNDSVSAASVSGAAVVEYAMKFLGYPYTAVGNSPSTGFSCIGFVSYVYQSLGINLPDDLGGAMAFAQPVAFSDLQPGDVLFFQNTVWNGLSHTAIYIGGGKFVHAEWYNRGVVISSFTNDPVDYNYWTAHYLGASRPWASASSSAVSTVPPAPRPPRSAAPVPANNPGVSSSPAPASTVSQLPTGPRAVVGVSFLNVRSGPSLRRPIRTVVARGTRVIVLRQRHGWYRVALPGGTIGWVIGVGIGKGTVSRRGTSDIAPRHTARHSLILRAKHISTQVSTRRTVTVTVSGLRVHTAPAITAPVAGLTGLGQRLIVVSRAYDWVKVRLPLGGTGWISGLYVRESSQLHASSLRLTASSSSRSSTGSRPRATSAARFAVNVRRTPSLTGAIISIVPPGGSFHIQSWLRGWARVRLPDGGLGWISGSVLGSTATTTTPAARTRPISALRSTVTAGVRLHSGPGLRRAVIRLVAAGTKVRVLGATAGWTRVRLPNRQTGYILGIYVLQ